MIASQTHLIDSLARFVGLLFAVMIPFFFIFVSSRKKYRKIRAELPAISGLGQEIVIYSSEGHFKNTGKGMVYEAIGRFASDPRGLLFRGEWLSGGGFEILFARGRARSSWMGRKWRKGIVAWFAIEQDGVNHYFSSDAPLKGPLALGKFKSSARGVFEQAEKILQDG